MKSLKIFVVMLFLFSSVAMSQYARRIQPSVSPLPATCNPLNGEVYALTSAGPTAGIYFCALTNTWRPMGFTGNQIIGAQGTITASAPWLSHTATWNNGAVNFVDHQVTITNTASGAGSLLIQYTVGATDIFTVSKTGNILMNGPSLKLGGNTGIGVEIFRTTPVAGITQGIVIRKADGTNAAFADLGAADNGSMIYCSDCTIASPCAGGGTGALAKRLNGAWVCN